jgi:uncharacterized protein (UPF0548 family)
VFRVGRVTASELAAIAERARRTGPTYADVGMSLRGGAPPAGFRGHRYAATLPPRHDAFPLAVDGLRRWAAHGHAGLTVAPSSPPAVGATVAIAAPLGPLTAVAVCRIVAVVDEPGRYGFAYGTLPGHPERGEESFVVERGAELDVVVFHIVSVSTPAERLARLGGPVTRLVQRRTTRRYLDGLARFVASGPSA